MKKLKSDIFDNNLSFMEIIKKYNFNTIDHIKDLTTLNNICYFNLTCNNINSYVHKNVLNYKEDYFVGLNLKCRKHTQLKKGDKLQTNYIYKITEIYKNHMIIKNELENKSYNVSNSIIKENFKYVYCSTIDSIQGKTIDDKITIMDSLLGYMSKRKFYTALTRATNLNNITFFVSPQNVINNFRENRFRQYFRLKVNNYKLQDKNKNRVWEEKDFITESWIGETFLKSSQCSLCFKSFELSINQNNDVISDLTVDRIDNNLPHIKSNCRLACNFCNCSKR
jgi:hypothetical protein